MIAFVALAPQLASAKTKKAHTVKVDTTMTLAIIGQTEDTYQFVARLTGKPFGTAAALGQTVLTSTPNGLITEEHPDRGHRGHLQRGRQG